MNIKNIFLTLGISLAIGLSTISFNNNNQYKPADAEKAKEKIIYVDISLNIKFLSEGSNPYIKVDGNGINLVKGENDIYYTTQNISLKDKTLELCCFNDEYSTHILTNTLLEEDNYNYICLSEYKVDELCDIKGYGYFGNKIVNPGATYLTQRIWLNNENQYFYNDDSFEGKCKNAIGYYDSKNVWRMIDMVSIINSSDGRTYYYADIPFELSEMYFLRVSANDYIIYQSVHKYIMCGTCYFAGVTLLEEYNNINVGIVDGADATLLGSVVEAYLTYGKSDTNGTVISTIKSLFNTWFNKKSATKDDLKNVKILDYSGYNKETGSYEGYPKDASYSVNEKWNTMCSFVGINPETGNESNIDISWFKSQEFKATMVIVGTAVVVISGIVIFLIIKKKRNVDTND